MTIDETLRHYPNINFCYTKTAIPVLPRMPDTYRWADEVEAEYWWHIEGAVWVNMNRGRTDIAVPINGLLDQQAYHS